MVADSESGDQAMEEASVLWDLPIRKEITKLLLWIYCLVAS